MDHLIRFIKQRVANPSCFYLFYMGSFWWWWCRASWNLQRGLPRIRKRSNLKDILKHPNMRGKVLQVQNSIFQCIRESWIQAYWTLPLQLLQWCCNPFLNFLYIRGRHSVRGTGFLNCWTRRLESPCRISRTQRTFCWWLKYWFQLWWWAPWLSLGRKWSI